jgi:cytochrome b6-f complex subunit 5
MVEPLLSGIVLGLIPIVIAGLLTIAYLQFRRRDPIEIDYILQHRKFLCSFYVIDLI